MSATLIQVYFSNLHMLHVMTSLLKHCKRCLSTASQSKNDCIVLLSSCQSHFPVLLGEQIELNLDHCDPINSRYLQQVGTCRFHSYEQLSIEILQMKTQETVMWKYHHFGKYMLQFNNIEMLCCHLSDYCLCMFSFGCMCL